MNLRQHTNIQHSAFLKLNHATSYDVKCDELCCVLSSIKLMIFLRFTRCWWLVRTTMIFPFTFSYIVICRVALRLSILTRGFAFDNCKLHKERVNDATRVEVTDWEFIPYIRRAAAAFKVNVSCVWLVMSVDLSYKVKQQQPATGAQGEGEVAAQNKSIECVKNPSRAIQRRWQVIYVTNNGASIVTAVSFCR